ncbi:MAG: DNA-processing protein DprA [Fimbriimonas sp.]
MPSSRFLQRLLATEASASKSRVLLGELGSLADSEAIAGLLVHPALTDAERRRAHQTSDDALANAERDGVRLRYGSDLPELVQEADGVPSAIFVHGDDTCLDAPTVAIVGTRSASVYGKACAMKFAEALARAGVTIVSGGALGIDAAAHRGALQAGGRTAAVLAAGIDNVYPAVHAGLFGQIREQGCLVSQFAVGTRPGEYRFLVRNGLVAALCQAVLVVEAPLRSGAMRTAHAAAEYGRDVFVVPANIDALTFAGSFALIREGATLVTHPDELLEAIGIDPAPPEEQVAPSGPGERILRVLSTLPIPTEKIVELSGMETAEVLSELTMLELEGRVIRDAGGYAIRP